MSLSFDSNTNYNFGGTSFTDYAELSYSARPEKLTFSFWVKEYISSPLAQRRGSILGEASGSTMQAMFNGAYNSGNIRGTAGYDGFEGLWDSANDATYGDGVFQHYLVVFDFTLSDANRMKVWRNGTAKTVSQHGTYIGSGNRETTTGAYRIGYGPANDWGGPFGTSMRIAEVSIFDYAGDATMASFLYNGGTGGGGSPMSASGGEPVWYNRMRTAGTGADAVIGTITTVSGANWNTTDNPTVDNPPSGVTVSPIIISIVSQQTTMQGA